MLLIPACLLYLIRTLGSNRHANCGPPMIVIHTYIHTYNANFQTGSCLKNRATVLGNLISIIINDVVSIVISLINGDGTASFTVT